MGSEMFAELTKANSAEITLNDNFGRDHLPVRWMIGRSPRAVYHAVLSYARMHGIDPSEVGYSVKYED